MNVVVRTARPTDLPGIQDLSDQVFRSQRPGQHMAQEFPWMYDPSNARHWAIALDGDEVVSIAGAMVWPALIAGAPTIAATTGSVATHPDYRGRGLASQILDHLEQDLFREGVRVMQISGDLPLYLRWGARPVGDVAWYRLLTAPKPSQTDFRVRPINPDADAGLVAVLNQSRSTRFGRTREQLQSMLGLQPLTIVEKGVPTALLVETSAGPAAYAVINHRPFDGRGASRVTEWAGDPQALLFALASVPDWPEAGMLVPALLEETALKSALAPEVPLRRQPVSWLAKVINGPGLVSDLHELWRERSAQELNAVPVDRFRTTIHLGDSQWTVDAPELAEWLFNPTAPSRPDALDAIWPVPALWSEGLNYV